tara:strand:+ start:711 stop:1451 length:741 start_codon:yes stop_codon:yes gene_type:complete
MSDYSKDYTSAKKGKIFIGRANRIIDFKPFVNSYSRDIKFSKDVRDSVYTAITRTGEFEEASYKLKISVVAVDAVEAISNHSKFQKLLRMVAPIGDEGTVAPFIFVKFANLLHNGFFPKAYESMGFAKLKDVGLKCNMEKLNYNPDLSMGFFEHNGMIFAKAFDLDLDLTILNAMDAGVGIVEVDKNRVIHGNRSGFIYGRSPMGANTETPTPTLEGGQTPEEAAEKAAEEAAKAAEEDALNDEFD